DGSANAGRIGGIDEIHIQADGDTGGIVHGVLEGFGHHVAQAALVNVAHSEDVNAGFLDDFAFLGVEIARADDDDVARLGFWLEAEEIDKLGRAVAHDGGEGHAMHVDRGRGIWRIDRNSTRLNSRDVAISYAYLCVEKKKKQ